MRFKVILVFHQIGVRCKNIFFTHGNYLAPFPNVGLRGTRAETEVVKGSWITENKVKRDNKGTKRNKLGRKEKQTVQVKNENGVFGFFFLSF